MRGPKRISGRIAGTIVAAVTAGLVAAPTAAAQDGRISLAEPKQLGLMEPATETMERLVDFHDLLLIVITAITALVFVLLGWIAVRYNRRANPNPSRVSHNTLIEIVWTVVPVMILVVIAIPSFKLLYFQDRIPEADLVIKATGHQWYWTYEYPDHDGVTFDAIMLPTSYWDDNASPAVVQERNRALNDLKDFLGRDTPPEIFRLLDTDTRVVVPVGKTVKVLVTASDVLHAWAIPAFGIKMDAVPGRLNETWFRADEIGTYYGQCSELCGIRHAFMPIAVEVVSQADFERWMTRAKELYATNAPAPARPAPVQLAGTEAAAGGR